MTDKIGGVIVTAPLWNGATEEHLRLIVKLLSGASRNYADDTTGGWSHGRAQVQTAARMVNEARLGFYAIQCLHRDKPQLVTLDQFMDAILKDLRNGA